MGTDSLHDDVIKWKHFPRYWPFVWGIHQSPVNSPHKSQWRGALMFSLICAWISGWVNNREAGDLRRYRTHYGVIVMVSEFGTEHGSTNAGLCTNLQNDLTIEMEILEEREFAISEFNSLWPSDTIWRHRSGSTLAQVMACCLTAPSHYLNQCWLIINKVQWHSSEHNYTRDTSAPKIKISLKMTYLKFHLNLPGANELRWVFVTDSVYCNIPPCTP